MTPPTSLPCFRLLWLSCVLACLLVVDGHAAPLTARTLRLPLGAGPEADPRALAVSPDGRWLAYVVIPKVVIPKPGRLALVLYDLTSARAQTVDLGPLDPRTDDTTSLLAWRPDSRACAVGIETGWAVVTPGRKRAQWIDRAHGVSGFDCRPAWSPRDGRLAVFSDGGDFWVWDGTRVRRKANWLKMTGIPSYASERPWQCEWSPDGKSILFRYYGDSGRDSNATGHLTIVDPGTGRFKWGAEAGPAHWLDDTQIAYRTSEVDTGGFEPEPLQVAQPAANKERLWRADIMAWSLTDRRDAVWIVTGKGDVWWTSLAKPHWRRVGHSDRHNQDDTLRLFLSPDGTQAALTTGDAVELFRLDGPVRQWRHPGSDIQVLGWAAGRTLPLLTVEPTQSGPSEVRQMEPQ